MQGSASINPQLGAATSSAVCAVIVALGLSFGVQIGLVTAMECLHKGVILAVQSIVASEALFPFPLSF